MRFLFGILFGLLLVAGGVAVVVFTGAFNTAATAPVTGVERTVANLALDKSVAKRAPNRKNPFPSSPEVLREGLKEYRENCVVCHGAPGLDAGPIGSGLNPAPPDLTLPRVQARSDGELFWLTGQGIRMTGMPAFAPTHSEEEIWEIVAFLRHLPELTDQEQDLLRVTEEEPKPAASLAPGVPPS